MTIIVVKTKDIRYEQRVSTTGSKIVKWCFPDMQITVHGKGTPTIALTNSTTHGAEYSDFSKSDFAGFDWISAKNYNGISRVFDQDCLVFKDKVKLDPESPADALQSAVAYIGADSRMPVILRAGDETRIYQFGPPPNDMLIPPPEIGKMVDRWRKSLREASLPPAKP